MWPEPPRCACGGGIDPELPVTGYADLVRAVKQRVPSMHVHAFSPMEIANGATKKRF